MDKIVNKNITEEFKESFLRYGMSVITDRALPDARDGLKPVHRRILYGMIEHFKLKSNKPYTKSATVCGGVMGYFHPHGDSSIYDAMARLSLSYIMRYPLVDGQGNFGSDDGDGPAASRYTEVRPTKIAELMTIGLAQKAVPMVPNFTETMEEPTVLPSLFPNALCNTSSGIAVGVATETPSHNLTEVCNGIIAYIKNNNISLDEMMTYIPGPDFCNKGCTIINKRDIKKAYETGKSAVSLKIRADYNYDKKKNEIHFYAIPYGVTRAKIRADIGKNVDELSKFIKDYNDNSNKNGTDFCFELNDGVSPERAANALYNYTSLRSTFSINNVFLVDKKPKLCSLLELIDIYVKFQEEVIINIAKFNKSKAEARLNIILGLLIALDKIDTVISIIRSAKDKNEAKEKLMAAIEVNAAQTDAILAMKLSQLTKMDKESLLSEKVEKENIIADCIKLIENKEYRDETLIKKVTEMRDKYGDERRTRLLDIEIPKEKKEIAAVAPEKCVVVMTKSGNIKRIAASSFKTQNRNGKGIKSQDDIVSATIRTNTIDQLLVFSNQGKMYKILVDDIPTGTNVSKGTPITSLVKMSDTEMPSLIYSVYHETKAKYICLITRNGKIKKTSLEECLNIKKKTGVPVIKLNEGDELISVFLLDEEEILVFNENGKCLHTDTKDIAATGRTAQGVKIMEPGILFAIPIRDMKDSVFIISKDGFGKRVSLADFNKTARTGKGVIIYKPEEHQIAGAAMVNNEDKVLISGSPCSICIDMKNINIIGRTATGVSIIKDSEVVSISKV